MSPSLFHYLLSPHDEPPVLRPRRRELGFARRRYCKNYVRFKRAAIASKGRVRRYLNLEQRSDGRKRASSGAPTANGSVILRLRRVGNSVHASYSVAGQPPQDFANDLNIAGWGRNLRVGVLAVNVATDKFKAEFKDFRLSP